MSKENNEHKVVYNYCDCNYVIQMFKVLLDAYISKSCIF